MGSNNSSANRAVDPDRVLIAAARHDADQVATETDTAAGSRAEATFATPPLDSFAGYRILREIHRGGQGVVYQAVQISTKRKVALKVLKDGPFGSPSDKARFDREVQVLGQLNHPNIVAIHDSGLAAGTQYFVMDYISGQPLDVYMASARRSIEETLGLAAKICEGVNAAHLRGIIHRDLKPGNIRVDANGEPHILDFGLAKIGSGGTETSPMTLTGEFVGSLPWASPEQAEGVPIKIDIRTDVYSLGVLLYQMLTGKFPYDVIGNMRDVLDRIMKAEPARPSTIRRQVNDEVETIVLKCLSKERDRRYQSAGELARDIKRYLAAEPIEAKRDSFWYVAQKALVRRKWHLAALVFILALTTVGYGMWAQARRVAESQRREHVASLIEADWASDSPETVALYEDFLTRFAVGETTSAEQELFLSNSVRLELRARGVAGLDWGFCGIIGAKARPGVAFKNHGVGPPIVYTTYSLADRSITDGSTWEWSTRAGVHTNGFEDVDLDELLTGVVVPADLELKAACNVAFYTREATQEWRESQRTVPIVTWWPPKTIALWQELRTVVTTIAVYQTLPEGYPPTASDPQTIQVVEEGFQPEVLWVGTEGQIGINYTYEGTVPLAGKLQVLDVVKGDVLGQIDHFIARQTADSGHFGSASRPLPEEFVETFQNGGVKEACIRIVPDRKVALSDPNIEIYYGGILEKTIPLRSASERR